MFELIKFFSRSPSPCQIATKQLEQTRLQLMDARNDLEHAQARLDMLRAREVRLSDFLILETELDDTKNIF